MNTDKDPEFTAPEGNRMGEYLIPCLQCESVRAHNFSTAATILPYCTAWAHQTVVLKAEAVYVEGG